MSNEVKGITRTDVHNILALLTADYKNMSRQKLEALGLVRNMTVKKLKQAIGEKT